MTMSIVKSTNQRMIVPFVPLITGSSPVEWTGVTATAIVTFAAGQSSHFSQPTTLVPLVMK
jgi:hypothetical protein